MRVRIVASLAATLVFAITACTEKPKSEESPGTSLKAAPGKAWTAPLGTFVALDGTSSTGPAGRPLQYDWMLTSRPTGSEAMLSDPSAVQPTFFADLPGTYVARLIVSTGSTWSDPSVFTITVLSGISDPNNRPPVAVIRPPAVPETKAVVALDGSQSHDPEGKPVTYAWSILKTPTGSHAKLDDPTSPSPRLETDMDGVFLVQLIVHDGQQPSAPVTAEVYVDTNPLSGKLNDLSYRLNPQHSGQISGGDLHPPFRRRWKIGVDQRNVSTLDKRVSGYPLVTQDAVYFLSNKQGDTCLLHGYDIATGTELWTPVSTDRSAYDKCGFGALAYSSGTLFTANRDGIIRAFNAKTSELRWSIAIPILHPENGYTSYLTPPVTAFEHVYVSTIDGDIVVLKQSNGQVEMTIPHVFGPSSSSTTIDIGMPAITQESIYVLGSNGTVYAHDRLTGTVQWTFTKPVSSGSGFTGADQELFVGSDFLYTTLGLDSTYLKLTGNISRPANISASRRALVAIHGNQAIVQDDLLDQFQDNAFSSVNMQTGVEQWRTRIPMSATTPPLIVNGHVIYGSNDGVIRVLDEDTGKLIWLDTPRETEPISLAASMIGKGDLGSNGDVLVVPFGGFEFIAYERDPNPASNDSYKSRCQSGTNRIYLIGDESQIGPNGLSLENGDVRLQGEQDISSTTGTMNITSPIHPLSSLPNSVSFSGKLSNASSGRVWSLDFEDTRGQSLQIGEYSPFNKGPVLYEDLSGPGVLSLGNSQDCNMKTGQFEITAINMDTNGLKHFSANFVYHCNFTAAAIRGCVNWERPAP